MWFLPLLLSGLMHDWTPARWASADPRSLDLVKGSPVNCLVQERPYWSAAFSDAAKPLGIAVLGLVRPEDDVAERVREATSEHLDGLVLEGDFEGRQLAAVDDLTTARKIAIIRLGRRDAIPLENAPPVVGTYQGVWPGIQAEEGGSTKAAPSGAPWIFTNGGFVRFVREATGRQVWLGNRPPANTVITADRYVQVIGDAAMAGAKWLIALEPEFEQRLLKGDAAARRDWNRMMLAARHFYQGGDWTQARPSGLLGLIEDVETGALLSGGVLDMIATKHTPVRPILARRISAASTAGLKMAVNIDPSSVAESQREELRNFSRRGGTLLNGPPGWRFPAPAPGQITLPDDATKQLDEIWREINNLIYRRNLGVRLFNVASTLSNLVESPDGQRLYLHLVNYADYPIESITVHSLGKCSSATLHVPGKAPRKLPLFEQDEGSGVEIDQLDSIATLVLER